MKKLSMITVILGLAAVAAYGATAKLTAPKAGEPWALNTTQAIAWTWSGSAKVKLVLDSKSLGKLGNIKADLDLGAGSCPWQVGALEKGKSAPAGTDYTIRIVNLSDGKELDTSPVFSITGGGQPPSMIKVVPFEGFIIPTSGKAITVSKPGKNDVWIPLKTYAVKWDWSVPVTANFKCGGGPSCVGCPVDIWLMPAAAASSAQKIMLVKARCSPYAISKGSTSYGNTYDGIVPNAASGSYFVRVALTGNENFYGDSQTFTVQSTLSPDTGFVGPDTMQNQVDLAVRDIFLNSDNSAIMMKVKNMGERFDGFVQFSYEIYVEGSSLKPTRFDHESHVIFQTNEEINFTVKDLGGFRFSGDSWARGKFIPEDTRPMKVTVKIASASDVNPGNNWAIKTLCRLDDADIGTDGEIKLTFSPKECLYLNRGTSNTIHESKVKWVDKETFAAELEVRIWNYGCRSKTYDIWLYADKLPGQCIFPGATLQAGDRTDFKRPVKVKLDSKCGNHSLVFIADPQEAKNQPYPDSYMNNFINVTLKILCGGGIEASSAQGSKKD